MVPTGYESWVVIVSCVSCVIGVLLILWLIMYLISPRKCYWYKGVTESEPFVKPTANGVTNHSFENIQNSRENCDHSFYLPQSEQEPYRQPTSSHEKVAKPIPAQRSRKNNYGKPVKKKYSIKDSFL